MHLKVLNDQIAEFGHGFIQQEMRQNDLDESYSVIFHLTKTIPSHWALVLGDACHNMRGALDHLIASLVPAGQVHNRHQFPIFNSRQSWQSEFRKSKTMLDFVAPAYKLLIESLQPYQPNTGMKRLELLRRFSNQDKHRLIHSAATHLTDEPVINVSRSFPMVVYSATSLSTGQPITSGSEVARFKATDTSPTSLHLPGGRIAFPASKLAGMIAVNATIVFGEAGKENTPVREFRHLHDDLAGLITQFE